MSGRDSQAERRVRSNIRRHERFDLVDADSAKAAFVQPTLLACTDGVAAKYVHDVEIFGPAATLVAYSCPRTPCASRVAA